MTQPTCPRCGTRHDADQRCRRLTGIITYAAMRRCPITSWDPAHYTETGCVCDQG